MLLGSIHCDSPHMSEELVGIHLVKSSGYIKKTATRAELTRELDVVLLLNGVKQHHSFIVLENISHQIKDVFVESSIEPPMVLKLCDVKEEWNGISKEIDLQKGPFGKFVLAHVLARELVVGNMHMLASLHQTDPFPQAVR